jgi:hypothetical protein
MAQKKRRTIIEEEVPQHDPIIVEDDPDTETLDYALRQFDDRNGLELKYYLAQPGGSAFIGAYPDIIPEAQLQEWYPSGGKFEIRIYIHGEFRDRKFMMIAPRPGGSVGNGNGSHDPYLREILTELRTMRQAPQTSVGELAQALKALHEIRPPESNNTAFLEAIKLGIQLSGGKVPIEEDDSFGGIVKGVLKEAGPSIVQGLLASRQVPNGPPNQLAAAPPAPTPEAQMGLVLKAGIQFLKKKAMAGADPELYIAFALDNCEDERFAPIIHAILTQDFSAFATLDAEISQPPYEQFFRTLYDGIRSEFSKANPVATAPSGSGGNVRNITNDAKPSKARSK